MTELLACSHRGPYVYRRTKGGFAGRRGGGGLINAVSLAMQRFGGTWIAAAMSAGDHELARAAPGGREEDGYRLQLLDLPAEAHSLHYDVMSNEYLWFAFHYLFDVPNDPVFDASYARAWDAYLAVNRSYAEAVSKVGGVDAVLVEDYHLMTVGRELRRMRKARVPLLYFHHTPWCEPDYLTVFPKALRIELLQALASYDVVGFHARRWADAFLRCCDRHLPRASVSGDEVRVGSRTTHVVVAPVPLDVVRIREQAASAPTQEWVRRLEELRRGRTVLARVDRIDLSKNPLRGFLAFEALLESDPSLASQVWFLAMQYPSRLKVDRYRRYFNRCTQVVARINERFGGRAPGDEGPLGWYFADDFHRSLAGMTICDAMLVNPVFDGLNLVAKEGAAVNDRDGSLILSRNAGVWEELGDVAFGVNPFDVLETADAMRCAIEATPEQRRRRAARLRRLAISGDPSNWVRRRSSAAGLLL